jgi:lipoprotein-releasing system permease protein
VRGIDPESVGSVVDLVKNIEVGNMEFLSHPERLVDLPAETVIGLGPGGQAYKKGPSIVPRDQVDSVVTEALRRESHS